MLNNFTLVIDDPDEHATVLPTEVGLRVRRYYVGLRDYCRCIVFCSGLDGDCGHGV
jgi:hypothetical protein